MKNIFLGALLLLSGLSVNAQTATNRPAPAAKSTFKPVFEKTYLHTDRDTYAQGDTLWFKAYLVNAQNNTPINSSGTLYVELIAPGSSNIISREIIRLDNGFGNGDFDLDDSLAAGKYRLRAYTSWMRNFGDNFIFEKEISILNTESISAALKRNANTPAANKTPAVTPTKLSANKGTSVRFYPEGGSLVEGIGSIVGVKAEDEMGKGIAVTGTILSSAGDTVSHFSCDSLGMGVFTLSPVKGQTYHALVKKASYNLPAALSTGLALQIKQIDTVLQVVISTTENPANNPVKPHYTLEVKHDGQALISQPIQMQEKQTRVKISTASLPEGVASVTLYDEHDKPNCERLVYIHHSNTAKLAVTLNKKTFRPKEPVSVQINAGHGAANLSMAVVDAGIAPEQEDDIVSYLMLGSELKGHVEHASQYFDAANADRFKQLDQLLLTQGWRDFVWRRLADTAIRISYAAENGLVVAGKVRDENRNKLLPNLNISMFATAAKGNKLFSARSDSSGRFNFHDLVLYGQQNIKLSSANDKGDKKGAITVDTLLPMPVQQQAAITTNAAADSTAIAAMEKKATQAKSKISGVTRLKEVKVSDRKNKAIVLRNGTVYTPWGTDQTLVITPKDYEYKTLAWFLTQKGKGAVPSLQGSGVNFIADGKRVRPRMIINGDEPYGVNQDMYYSMPIEKFKSVQIREAAWGAKLVFLLYLNLKDNYLTDNPGTLSLNIDGYYQARTFYKPLPGAKTSVADFRTTIHWEPNIKTDANGNAVVNFTNTIPQTQVRVIVQGIASGSIPVAAISNYTIK